MDKTVLCCRSVYFRIFFPPLFSGDFNASDNSKSTKLDPRLQELATLKAETAALKARDRAAAEALVEDSGDIQFSGLVVRWASLLEWFYSLIT